MGKKIFDVGLGVPINGFQAASIGCSGLQVKRYRWVGCLHSTREVHSEPLLTNASIQCPTVMSPTAVGPILPAYLRQDHSKTIL